MHQKVPKWLVKLQNHRIANQKKIVGMDLCHPQFSSWVAVKTDLELTA